MLWVAHSYFQITFSITFFVRGRLALHTLASLISTVLSMVFLPEFEDQFGVALVLPNKGEHVDCFPGPVFKLHSPPKEK